MTDPKRLVVRSWVGSETGGYDHERFAEQMRGIPPIDWDTEQEMVIAEPFFSYVVHDAVARAGRAELLMDLVRRWEEFLVDGYDTFGECWGWGTPVHGWSSTPTARPDLVRAWRHTSRAGIPPRTGSASAWTAARGRWCSTNAARVCRSAGDGRGG